MICPQCKANNERTINTGESLDGRETIRRHQCLTCRHRWNTRELDANRLQSPLPMTKRNARGRSFLSHILGEHTSPCSTS